jgi:uncharacterized coiled-coil protein SlyX
MEDREALEEQVQCMRTTVALIRQALELEVTAHNTETLAKYLVPCDKSTLKLSEARENCSKPRLQSRNRPEACLQAAEGILTERNRTLPSPSEQLGQGSEQLLEAQLRLLEKSYKKRTREVTHLQTKLSIMEIERGKELKHRHKLEDRIKDLESRITAQSSEISSLHTALSEAQTRLQGVETLEEDLKQLSKERELLVQTFESCPLLVAGFEDAKEMRKYREFYDKVKALACEHDLGLDSDMTQVESWATHLVKDSAQLKDTSQETCTLLQEVMQAFGLASPREAVLKLREWLSEGISEIQNT